MMVKIFVLLGLVVVSATATELPGAEGGASAKAVATAKKTIAHRLLALEPDVEQKPVLELKLEAMIDRALRKFGARQAAETEVATARRFFRAVDEALIEEAAIFPPSEQVDLLINALRPRTLSAEEYKRALGSLSNMRRRQVMESAHRLEEPFYFFDCDVACVIYLAVAERLEMPVYMVETSGHNFVRWHSSNVRLNWDTNDGLVAPDGYYWKGSPDSEMRLLGYMENRSESRVTSYWLIRCAQEFERRGEHARALQVLRYAVEIEPKDFVAQGELAWELATATDDKIRSGREARAIAEKLVALMPRRCWLETLAAASAEYGDYISAAKYQREAQKWVLAHYTQVPSETKQYHQALITAYEKNLTYVLAVRKKLITPTLGVGAAR